MNELENTRLTNPQINNSSLYGSHISGAQLLDVSINARYIDSGQIKVNGIDLTTEMARLACELESQKKFNKILLNILIQKGILDNMDEYKEILDAHLVASKLSGKEV